MTNPGEGRGDKKEDSVRLLFTSRLRSHSIQEIVSICVLNDIHISYRKILV